MLSYYTTREAAELVGIPYKRLWYAVRVGSVQATKTVGRFRLFDDYNIADIRRHFGIRSDDVVDKKAEKLA